MDCNDVKPRLEACVMGRLSAEEKTAVDAHFATCEGCRLELELARAVLAPPGYSTSSLSPPASASNPETLSLASVEPEPQLAPHVEPSAVHLPELRSAPDTAPKADAGAAPSLDMLSTDAAATDAKPKKVRWGFEPAEPPREAPPPEKSLFFAEEALARKEKPAERGAKLPVRRLAMWSGGALLGLGLLAVSVWMALASHEVPPQGPNHAVSVGAHPGLTVPSKPATPGASVPGSPAPQQASSTTPSAPSAAASPPGSPAALPPANVPNVKATASTPPIATAPTATTPTATAPTATAPTATARPTATATAPPIATARPTATASTPSPKEDTPPVPFVTKIKTPAKPDHDDMADDFKTDPEAEPSKDAEVIHVPLTKHAGGGFQATPRTAPPTNSEATPAPAPTSKALESEAPTISGPIDRLHLATEHATKTSDLDALRRLKVTWKTFIHTSTGVDRSRAKREYADCLWGIQAVTGHDSDRREALAAYRDFVLNAPAGGSDPRTIGRMRTLEDALSESK